MEAPPLPTTPAHVAATRRPRRWWGWSITALALTALVVTGWGVGASMSDYYGSIAFSMSQNWANFFFGALDPSGTVTLDKIPGSFWIPALFVRVFGFSPWAVVIPNALAATASVVLVAFTTRRWAGPTAGFVAGAVVATTPILVAVARSNQPETFFVLCLALTAWAATKALDRRSLGWLVAAGAFIAAGFHTYMLEAWAVWPALAAAYLCTRQSWARRLAHVAIAGVTSLALSLVWIIAVSLVPASSRPYIGSTLTNNPWEMVFGYNGLGRFGGTTADASAYRSFTPPFSGNPAVFRLLNDALAAQIGWMLPVTIVAVGILFVLRFRLPLTIFASVWFATFAVMFSAVAGMHQFYTAALAIPMALIIGTAFAASRERRSMWAQLALPLTAAVSALAISLGVGGGRYTVPTALVQCVLAVVATVLVLWEVRRGVRMPVTAIVAAVALVLTPAVWSVATMTTPNSTNPVAGGASSIGSGGFGGRGVPGGFSGGQPGQGGGQPGQGAGQAGQGGRGGFPGQGGAPGGGARGASDAATIAWLEEHRGDASYLVAAFGAQSAAGLIIASGGEPVLPIGGFNGADPAPTLAAFVHLVQSGELRYVLMSGGEIGGGRGGGTGGGADTSTSAQIRTWVTANCTVVTDASASGIYDCAG
jgi:4-amino-4-deoxy-L-arabinose transferase-like glycosyltransferase